MLGDDEIDQPRRLAVALDAAAADEVRRHRDAGGIGPAARDHIAAIHPRPLAAGRCAMRCAEVPVGSEDLSLHLFREVRPHHQGVGGSEGEAPGRAGMAAADLHHHPQEGGEVELIAAEHLRLQDAVEAGRLERLVHLRAVMAARVGVVLLRAQHRDQGLGPLDHGLRGQARLRVRPVAGARRPIRDRAVRHDRLRLFVEL